MNREIYYASIVEGGAPQEIRISHTPAESSFPCIASDSLDAYVLWEEVIGLHSDIMYARIRDGEVAVKKRLKRTYLDSSCPVAAMGPDGALHIAWHEGPFKQTAIYYGRVEGDSLVEEYGVCTKYPEAFRPAISCDGDGRVMLIWPEGDRMSSRLYNGSEWEERKMIAGLEYIPWRVSVAGLKDGRWAASWFDGRNDTNRVYVAFCEGKEWQEPELLAGDRLATSYYPDLAVAESGELVAVYESRVPSENYCTIHTRCYDGTTWGDPVEVYRHRAPGRYASITFHKGVLHSVWFSLMVDSDEIYYSTMRSDR
jgi:hypothetical protein